MPSKARKSTKTRTKRAEAKPRPARSAAKPDTSSRSKLDAIVAALRAPGGASLDELQALTGWQQHSVRGVLSGALKNQRGLAIVSAKADGERRYRIETRK